MARPMLISVITINFNGAGHIEKTIKSVLEQSCDDIQYIVIDGGSTDGSLEIINRYSNNIHYLISEADGGIADAMNKGIRQATGDYLVFLHADDVFTSSTSIAEACKYINHSHSIIACDIFYGQKKPRYSSRGFNFWINFKTGLMHQGVLCPRTIFEQIGEFDTQFRIAMDYDFFLRAYRHEIPLVNCPVILSTMGDAGISSQKDWPSLLERFGEEKKVHQKNCSSFLMKLVYIIYWPVYISYRRIKYSINTIAN